MAATRALSRAASAASASSSARNSDARPAGGRRIRGAGRHVLERRTIARHALERPHRHVAEAAAQAPSPAAPRDRSIGRERLQPNRGHFGPARDRPERLLVGHQPGRAPRGSRSRASPSSRRAAGASAPTPPASAPSASTAARLDGLVGLVRAERDVEQHAGGFVAHALVGVRAHRVGQHRHGAQLAHRGATHARIVIGARDRREQFLFVLRKSPGRPPPAPSGRLTSILAVS